MKTTNILIFYSKSYKFLIVLLAILLFLESCQEKSQEPKYKSTDLDFFDLKGKVKRFGCMNITNFGVFPIETGIFQNESENKYFKYFSSHSLVYNFSPNEMIEFMQVGNNEIEVQKERTVDTLKISYNYKNWAGNNNTRILSDSLLISYTNIPSDPFFAEYKKDYRKIDSLHIDIAFKKITNFRCNNVNVKNRLKNENGLDSLINIEANIFSYKTKENSTVEYFIIYPKYDVKGNWIKKQTYFLKQPLIGSLIYSSYRKIEYYE